MLAAILHEVAKPLREYMAAKNAGIIGVSDHGGWAILVTVARDGTVLDRRRVELVDDALPALPHHHEGQMLPMEAAVALVKRVCASAERHAALALDAVRKSRFALAQRFIGGAFLCGLAFAVSKAIEYTEKLNAGISLLTNDFFMYYFTLTGIHLFHVVAGNVVLLVLWFMARSRSFDPERPVVLECGAIYWHMVDLLWIILFPLLYLVR